MPERLIIPNNLLLSRAAQAVARGVIAKIPVRGHSMDPFIHGNHDCVELYPPVNISRGDLVLAKINGEQYLLHRVLCFVGEDGVVLMGDGNVGITESCTIKDIKAKALVIISKNGKRKCLDSWEMKTAARLWRGMMPIRGALLYLFRRFFRK